MEFDESTKHETSQRPANISEPELQMALETLRSEQNLVMGTLAGLIAATVGAAIWAAVTVLSNYQIGWIAIGIGFLVGFSMRAVGKGLDQIYGVVGAVLSLFGCALGNLLAVTYFISADQGIPFVEFLAQLDLDVAIELVATTFNPMDLLFYAIAAYFGYRYAFRELTDADFARALGKGF